MREVGSCVVPVDGDAGVWGRDEGADEGTPYAKTPSVESDLKWIAMVSTSPIPGSVGAATYEEADDGIVWLWVDAILIGDEG